MRLCFSCASVFIFCARVNFSPNKMRRTPQITRRKKELAKETRAPTLVRYIIGGEKLLNDFGRLAVYFISYIQFE